MASGCQVPPKGMRKDLVPCKSSPLHARDKTATQTSAARDTFSNGSNWGHLGHGNCRPSPILGHKRLQDTGLRTLGHSRKSGERNTLVGKTYKRELLWQGGL